jgi:hypothetical protein
MTLSAQHHLAKDDGYLSRKCFHRIPQHISGIPIIQDAIHRIQKPTVEVDESFEVGVGLEAPSSPPGDEDGSVMDLDEVEADMDLDNVDPSAGAGADGDGEVARVQMSPEAPSPKGKCPISPLTGPNHFMCIGKKNITPPPPQVASEVASESDSDSDSSSSSSSSSSDSNGVAVETKTAQGKRAMTSSQACASLTSMHRNKTHRSSPTAGT